jgi:hypothetical protein
MVKKPLLRNFVVPYDKKKVNLEGTDFEVVIVKETIKSILLTTNNL